MWRKRFQHFRIRRMSRCSGKDIHQRFLTSYNPIRAFSNTFYFQSASCCCLFRRSFTHRWRFISLRQQWVRKCKKILPFTVVEFGDSSRANGILADCIRYVNSWLPSRKRPYLPPACSDESNVCRIAFSNWYHSLNLGYGLLECSLLPRMMELTYIVAWKPMQIANSGRIKGTARTKIEMRVAIKATLLFHCPALQEQSLKS